MLTSLWNVLSRKNKGIEPCSRSLMKWSIRARASCQKNLSDGKILSSITSKNWRSHEDSKRSRQISRQAASFAGTESQTPGAKGSRFRTAPKAREPVSLPVEVLPNENLDADRCDFSDIRIFIRRASDNTCTTLELSAASGSVKLPRKFP